MLLTVVSPAPGCVCFSSPGLKELTLLFLLLRATYRPEATYRRGLLLLGLPEGTVCCGRDSMEADIFSLRVTGTRGCHYFHVATQEAENSARAGGGYNHQRSTPAARVHHLLGTASQRFRSHHHQLGTKCSEHKPGRGHFTFRQLDQEQSWVTNYAW